MKKIGTKREHVETKKFIKNIICDVCKQDVRLFADSYDNSKIRIDGLIGNTYPEVDSRELYIIDVCPTCFLNKIKPLIEKTYKLNFRTMDYEEGLHKHEFY
jgi:uncharacterized protein YbbC (DUF1343 family)